MARTNYPDYRGHQIYQDEWEYKGQIVKDSFSVWVIGGGLLGGARSIEEAHALIDRTIAENGAFEATAEPYDDSSDDELIPIVERLGL